MTDLNISLSFLPQRGRGQSIDKRMRLELSASLDHIKYQLLQHVTDITLSKQLYYLDDLIVALCGDSKVSPAVFGFYYQLVFSILAGEDAHIISQQLSRLLSSFQAVSGISLKDLSESDLGNVEIVSMYQQCLDTDTDVKYGFLSPDKRDSQRVRDSIGTTMNLMEKTIPDLHTEIKAIVCEFLLASAPKTKEAPKFDGASSYQLWGAVALNADNHKSEIEMLKTLVHECSHSLLFGLTVDEPLVFNDDSERYRSPLRADPRPMDGIYHATFVSARMYYALVEALKSGLLSNAQRQECEAHLAASRKAFNDGYAVVSAHAEYSDTGREIMQNAYEYMQQVASAVAVA